MDLVFQENRLGYLSRILCETVAQEQTAELIIPDSCPDAERVIDAFGTALIRSVECAADSAAVTGQVQAGVLFVTEGDAVERLETAVPFSLRREYEKAEDECTVQCNCTVRSVDARMLNSRKLLIRVGIVCTIMVYARVDHTMYDLSDPTPTLQLKRTQLPVRAPLALGEKSFVLNEEVEVPTSKPAIARLLKCVYRTELLEQKLVGSKAVFKGNLTVHALYESTDATLQILETKLPFSQYVDMEYELDDRDLQTMLTLTAAEAEQDGQAECRRILLSISILAQCTAYGEHKVDLIEDAYCTDAQLLPQWDEWDMCGILDQQNFRATAIASADTPMGNVVDAWMYADEVVKKRQGDRMLFELPIACSVLYYDADGALQGKTMRSGVNFDTDIEQNGDCRVTNISGGEIFCTAGSNGIEIRVPVDLDIECFANHKLRCICGGKIEELAEHGGRKPSVILRRTEQEQEVWDIAKAYHAQTKAVIEANDLQTPVVSPGTMLLIPM